MGVDAATPALVVGELVRAGGVAVDAGAGDRQRTRLEVGGDAPALLLVGRVLVDVRVGHGEVGAVVVDAAALVVTDLVPVHGASAHGRVTALVGDASAVVAREVAVDVGVRDRDRERPALTRNGRGRADPD